MDKTNKTRNLRLCTWQRLLLASLLAMGSNPLFAAAKEEQRTNNPALQAQEHDFAEAEAAVKSHPLKEAYFGELHMHTSYSLDAYIGGNRNTPDAAYRFAKGEDITIHGDRHNIVKPLDFAAVTDHAEYIGELYSTQNKDAPGYDNALLTELRGLTSMEEQEAWFFKYVVTPARKGATGHPSFWAGEETTASAWQMMQTVAESHYKPGVFTTLLGFEWTSSPSGGNMHRNVVFRDMRAPRLPFTSIDSRDEEKLWEWMAQQAEQGSTLLAIPHNSNASKGLMFEPVDNSGKPLDAQYAKNRAKWEPLIEMMQIKGNSEVNRKLWPADEFADFENGDSIALYSERTFTKPNYVRWAVGKGLHYAQTLGENPYKLGFVGGTDNHNGAMSDVVEDNYIGSHGPMDGSVKQRREGEIPQWIKARDSSPGSITGVWASKNTRSEIYDALAARESFVTSGTRIKPRFFAGADLSAAKTPKALVEQGYKQGVAMGGTLQGLKKSPIFSVYASKDPDGANLDRIQIVKSWVDASGEPQDTVFDVVWSGERKIAANGKLAAVGNTVDLKTAAYTNTIGSAELMGTWSDATFDPKQHAAYYVRVLEIPTPRWTTYDAVRNNLPLLDDVPATIQERAWTSPIWYTP
jgi:hypothetical protein